MAQTIKITDATGFAVPPPVLEAANDRSWIRASNKTTLPDVICVHTNSSAYSVVGPSYPSLLLCNNSWLVQDKSYKPFVWVFQAMSSTESATGPDSVPTFIVNLFNSETYSDLRITCGGQSWSAHKAVVCTQSVWFARTCSSTSKVSTSSHGVQ